MPFFFVLILIKHIFREETEKYWNFENYFLAYEQQPTRQAKNHIQWIMTQKNIL